jgi:hypothetical protein
MRLVPLLRPRNAGCRRAVPAPDAQEHPMLDVLMLALAFGFFAAAIGYTYACERL